MAFSGISGLTAIAGYQQLVDENAQATPEQRSGDIADPRHGEWGESGHPYPWESSYGATDGIPGPYGPDNQLLGDEDWFLTPAGIPQQDPTLDRTPASRAAPKPKGILSGPIPGETPDDIAFQLHQSRTIHGIDTGASERRIHSPQAVGIQNDEWEAPIDDVSPGHSELKTLPKQAVSSGFMWGTRDRTQSMAGQNAYGFDSAHKFRRVATGAIPGNTMWMIPGGRPLAKSLPGPARPPIGPDSPFAGQDLGEAFRVKGAILENQPREYTPPPQPNLAPPVQQYGDTGVVEWW